MIKSTNHSPGIKRVLSLLLSLLLIVSAVPFTAVTAKASEEHFHTGECEHTLCDNTCDGDCGSICGDCDNDCNGECDGHCNDCGECDEAYGEGEIIEYYDFFAESGAVSATPEEVKAMIDALPEVSQLPGMSEDELNEVYENAQNACDAYEALTEEEQEQLEAEFNKLYELLTYMSEQESPTASGEIDCITKIAVAAAGDEDTAKGKLSGYRIIDKDLNDGAGGDYVYMGYKFEWASSGFVTGIVFWKTESETASAPSSVSYGGRTYNLLGSSAEPNDGGGVVDLNSGTDDMRIYMYITRDVTLKPLVSFYYKTGKSNSSGACVDTSGKPQDLNEDARGDYIWLFANQTNEKYSSSWTTNSTHHWHVLEANGGTLPTYYTDKAEHTLSSSTGKCTVCGYSCKHSWSNGTCKTCKMAHSGHSWSNGKCTVCGLYCSHSWSNGTCKTCKMAHSGHSWSNGKCTVCGLSCSHSWNSGICTICEISHTGHSWSNGVCTVCGYGCSHSWSSGTCTICKIEHTDHTYSKGYCTVCGFAHSGHTWSKGACAVCGYECRHSYSDTICTVCGACNINYIDCVWNSSTNKVDTSTKQINDTVTFVNSSTTSWSNGWYVVRSSTDISSRITVSGTVHLLLCDGVTLNAKKGISVWGGNTLYIYSQSNNATNTGRLVATGGSNDAGIGGELKSSNQSYSKYCGTVVINGGVVTATGSAAKNSATGTYMHGSAGIGGAYNWANGGTVTVNGGTVIATGATAQCGGAGIGGSAFGNGASVSINGGNVKAVGGKSTGGEVPNAPAIGGGAGASNNGTLKNSTGTDVTLKTYTLDGITSQTRITAVDGYNYCAHDIYTLDTNKLYLYIPSDGAVTSVTTSGGQVFKPKNAGETTLYCAHAKRSNNICVHCGVYYDGSKTINVPAKDSTGAYLLYNLNDLIWFAVTVNNGNTSINGKMMSNIDASSLSAIEIGKSASVAYSGTFDGNYKTLKIDIVSKSQYVAPFPYVNGATIKNLTVEGSITTTHKFAAGIVGRVESGDVTLENCLSFVDIDSSNFTDGNKNDGTHGGLIAVADGGTTTINNCGFAGSMVGSTTRYCGGLVGWAGSTVKINNSYVAAYFDLDTSESGDTFSRNQKNVTLTNCYYLTKLSDDIMSGATQKDSTKFSNGEVTYRLNGNKSDGVWKQTVNTNTYPNFTGKTVYYGYTSCADNAVAGYTNNSGATSAKPSHTYKNGICERTSGETHYEPAILKNGAYEIENAGNLFWFAEYVNKGNKEANAVLNADIDLENRAWTPIGRHSDSKPDSTNSLSYSGTFDGNYHTISNLNVNMTNTYEAGLFSRTYGATLKNFGIVNASVTQNNTGTDGKGIRAGVIAGELHKSTVTNVFTSGAITVTTKHDQAGGISGEAAESTLKYCYTTFGCLTGSGDGLKTGITNCYYLANSKNSASFGENKTADQFASGEVAYLLQMANGSTLVWGQKSSEDGSLPILTSNEDYRVIPVKSGDDVVNYSVLHKGDTNNDGEVTIADYQALVNIALSDSNTKAAATKYDLNGDGVFDVLDCALAERSGMNETDYKALVSKALASEPVYNARADFDGDGVVDVLDCATAERMLACHRVRV